MKEKKREEKNNFQDQKELMVGKDEARTNYILLSSKLIEFFTWKDSIKINQPVIKFETDARIFLASAKLFTLKTTKRQLLRGI